MNMKYSLIWLLIILFCIVSVCNLSISLKPTAFAETLLAQYEIEVQLKALEKEIDILMKQPKTMKHLEKFKELHDHRKILNEKLAFYKSDGRYSSRKFSCGNAYIPFVILMCSAIFFFVLAITPYTNLLPLFVRASSLLTASLLGIIVITQWIMVWLIVPTWYAKITATILILISIISFVICWIFFISKFFIRRRALNKKQR